MQDNLFSDLSQLLPYLAELQRKIYLLKRLHSQLKELQVESITLQCDGICITIDQNSFPFNLDMEMAILIKDAIDHLENQSRNLEELSNI